MADNTNQNLPEENGGSVLGDIIKQATTDILKPKLFDVLNSAATDAVYGIGDWIVGIINRKIQQYSPNTNLRNRNGSSGGTNYNKISSSPQTNLGLRSSDDLLEIIFNTESEAMSVKNEMIERIKKYNKVSVGFLYEKAHKSTISSDYRYGWTDEKDIHYTRNRFGYFFDLPKPKPIV